MTVKKFCGQCATQRDGDTCWKCGSEMFVPANGWADPPLPEVHPIRMIAKEFGYAIAEHGSKEADLDLIAVPWVATNMTQREFVFRLAKAINAIVLETEDKPMGRFAATLQIDGWFKPIDLSVTPWPDQGLSTVQGNDKGITSIDGVQHKVLGWQNYPGWSK